MSDIAALFHQLTLGVYVIGVANAGRCGGFTAAWVMQVSFDPLLLALSINPGNASYLLLRSGGSFTVNVVKREQLEWRGGSEPSPLVITTSSRASGGGRGATGRLFWRRRWPTLTVN